MQATGGDDLARRKVLQRNAVLYLLFALLIIIPFGVFIVAGVDATQFGLGGIAGPMVAFSAGVLSFLSPCVLPLVPIYITNLAGATFDSEGRPTATRGQTFPHAVAFMVGLSVVFIALGASVGLIGFVLIDNLQALETAAGLLLIALGILIIPEIGQRSLMRSAVLLLAMTVVLIGTVELAQLQGDTERLLLLVAALGLAWAKFSGFLPVFGLLQRTFQFTPGTKKSASYSRSALIGSAFATGWTPCVGPILGGVLALAAASGSAWTGAYLLSFYAFGFSVPFLIAGLAVGDAQRRIRRLQRFMPYFEVASALMLLGLGMLLITGRLTQINNWFIGLSDWQGL
jgi:cytochrome c-type biogenesis protein